MTSRDTGTGLVLEQMILPALRKGGYEYQTHVDIGERFGGGRHLVDILAWDSTGSTFLISMKWQQVSGTAEQKVPFEAMCLAEAVLTSDNKYNRAYLVLGGNGWKLRNFFVNGGLSKHLRYDNLVLIVTLETFVAKANKSEL
jgi:hypothetical protein